MTGTADVVNRPANTEALVTQWPWPAWLVTSQGEGHLVPATTSPRADAIATLVIDVLTGTIGGRPEALSQLDDHSPVPGVVVEPG